MRIGLVLPATDVETARRLPTLAASAERLGFASVSVTDRLKYAVLDPIALLGAIAAATERVELMTAVLLSPLRPIEMLIQQLVTIDRLAGGHRLTLGLGVGSRIDDYAAAGADFAARGRTLDEQLAALRAVADLKPPPILIGGSSPAALRRAARADGWLAGPGSMRSFDSGMAAVGHEWDELGRRGTPRVAAIAYCALGDGGAAVAEAVFGRYYAFVGERGARWIVDSARTTPEALAEIAGEYGAHGCHDLLVAPATLDESVLNEIAGALL